VVARARERESDFEERTYVSLLAAPSRSTRFRFLRDLSPITVS